MSTAENKAVFLSYASQDAEAARRICEALRSGGVEVWFDSDGGLEHGDEWDAKIRRQIKECVLFIPIISANTQARHEGYFRIEWELAAQRALGIASGVPFILPVVIDGTREPDALVPDRFRMVQWTKLRGGEVPPEVQQRFLKLWSHRTGVLKHEAARASGLSEPLTAREAVGKPGAKAYVLIAVVVALIVAAVAWWQFRSAPPAIVAEIAAVPAKTFSEAEQLVKQAREIVYDPDSARNEFGLAENLLKRATDLAPTSGEAWGASALLNHYFYSRAYDRERQRLARSLAEAEKALRLSPHNTDALLAMGLHRQVMGETERAKDFLEQAHASDPQNYKVILAQSLQIADFVERARFLREAAAYVARPAELYYYAGNDFDFAGRWDEAREANNRAVAAQPFWRTFVQGAVIEYTALADPAKIDVWLDRVPELKRDEPRVAFMRFLAASLRRDGVGAVRVLNALAADFLEDNFFTGPKSYLLALAYELDGQPALALEQWQLAERVVRGKLAVNPSDRFLRPMLAVMLAAQHRTDEARQIAAMCEADERVMRDWVAREILAVAHARLGEPDRAIALLSGERLPTQHWGDVSAATLAVEPRWDTLRDRPNYPQLLEQLRRAENGGAGTPTSTAAKPEDKSVAVLAFANLSDDKANEYFSDGISEELLNVLAKISDLKVSARTSAFYFKGKEVPVPEIAKQLGVAYVVEGSVRKAGGKVRITAQLIKAADGFHVWSETFTRELKDVFSVQDEIAGLIAKNLSLKMGLATARPESVNAEAYQHLFQARYYSRQDNNEGWLRSIAECKAALALDPDFALAAAEMARSYIQLARFGGINAEEGYRLARGPAEHALAVDPNLAEAHNAFGWVQRTADWNWAGADASFRRAHELAPRNATMIGDYAIVRQNQGYTEDARRLAREALELDPLNASTRGHYSLFLGWAGGYAQREEAILQLKRALELSPTATEWHEYLARFQSLQGRFDEAAASADLEPSERYRLVARALVLVARKDRAGAERVLRELIGKYADAMSFYIGEIYANAGENNLAFEWLERARQHRDTGLCWILGSPAMQPITNDPRWPVFLRKLGHEVPAKSS